MTRSVLTLIVFTGTLVLASAKLFRQVPFIKEEVYDMSLYYQNQSQMTGFCGNATLSAITINGKLYNGKTLFKANCASCHRADKVLIGPALMGVKQRWEEAGIGNKLYDWVRNPKKVLDEGHPYVKKLVKDFNNQALMTLQAPEQRRN